MGPPVQRDANRDTLHAAWLAGYGAGLATGIYSRPTDDEIQVWAAELVARAWAAGYAAARAEEEHATRIRALARVPTMAERDRAGRIPRKGPTR